VKTLGARAVCVEPIFREAGAYIIQYFNSYHSTSELKLRHRLACFSIGFEKEYLRSAGESDFDPSCTCTLLSAGISYLSLNQSSYTVVQLTLSLSIYAGIGDTFCL
jgi:hypothetical protein